MRVLKWVRRLACDQHGSILVQFTVYLVALFGLAGLLWDTGRYLLAHNDLQDLADAAASAGAAELDVTRNSFNDAKTFLTNDVRWPDLEGTAHGGGHAMRKGPARSSQATPIWTRFRFWTPIGELLKVPL